MDKIVLLGGSDPLPGRLASCLAEEGISCTVLRGEAELPEPGPSRPFVYLASSHGDGGPRAARAELVFRKLASRSDLQPILVSSSEVFHPTHRHLGLCAEEPLPPAPESSRAMAWRRLEERSQAALGRDLTLLRPAPMPIRDGQDPLSRSLASERPRLPAGFDPPLQVLSLGDLGRGILAAAQAALPGIFQLAPSRSVPVGRAFEIAGGRPRWSLFRGGSIEPILRHSSTISSARASRELGWQARHDSVEALRLNLELPSGPVEAHDDFGFDQGYIDRLGKTLFRFLHDIYWRVEYRGLEHVPREGRVVLAGIHRGFQPWDGVMALHLMARETGRYPRFLVHPTLLKSPFLAPYMMKLGGLPACQENASHILESEEIVGIFPEGIQGAFSLYRDAYRLRRFGRDEFVRLALRHQAPILPFVTVGSAEAFPIFKKYNWRWWKQKSEWPSFPITSPLPLPSKWHTEFFPPIPVQERYPPEASEDRQVVRKLSAEVRGIFEESMSRLRRRRPSIFWGSAFGEEG